MISNYISTGQKVYSNAIIVVIMSALISSCSNNDDTEWIGEYEGSSPTIDSVETVPLGDSVALSIREIDGDIEFLIINGSTDSVCVLTSVWNVLNYSNLCRPWEPQTLREMNINTISFLDDKKHDYTLHYIKTNRFAIHRPDHAFYVLAPTDTSIFLISGIILPSCAELPWIQVLMPVWRIHTLSQFQKKLIKGKQQIKLGKFAKMTPNRPKYIEDSLKSIDCFLLYCPIDGVPNVMNKPDSSLRWGLPKNTAGSLYGEFLRSAK